MKQRLLSELKKLAIIVILGAVYLVVSIWFDVAIPCLFHLITGYLCPSCGITRMIQSVVLLDFRTAYEYNKALFLTLPIITLLIIASELRYIKYGSRKLSKTMNVLLWIEVAILVVFGVVRNLI